MKNAFIGLCILLLGGALAYTVFEQKNIEHQVSSVSETVENDGVAIKATTKEISEDFLSVVEAVGDTSEANEKATKALEAEFRALEDQVTYGSAVPLDQLPNDEHAFHLSVFTTDNWKANKQEADILNWFETDTQLKKLKSQVIYHHYTPSNELYGRYKGAVYHGLPVVYLQTAAGDNVYHKTGTAIPKTARRLVYDIHKHIRNCPNCQPNHRPNNTVNVTTTYPLVPDTTDPEEEARKKREHERLLEISIRRKLEREQQAKNAELNKKKEVAKEDSTVWAIAGGGAAVVFILVWVLMTKSYQGQ